MRLDIGTLALITSVVFTAQTIALFVQPEIPDLL